MNLNIYKLFFAISLGLLIGCSPEDPIESSITYYAEFELTDGQYVFINQGETYEEPGVQALAGGQSLEVETTGTVDTSTPGVYTITYSATNEDGFPATINRYVAVGDKATAENRDLSGSYSPANKVSKISGAFYQASDILPPNAIKVVLIDLGNGTLVVPPQSSPFGTVYADPLVDPNTGGTIDSETSFTLATQIASFGIYTRTFTLQ